MKVTLGSPQCPSSLELKASPLFQKGARSLTSHNHHVCIGDFYVSFSQAASDGLKTNFIMFG